MSLEDVHYLKYSSAGVLDATLTGVLALRRAVKRRPEGLGGNSQGVPERTRWHLDAASLQTAASDATFRPRRGDRIVSADSGTWVIEMVEDATWKTRHACDCVRQLGA